MKQYFLYTVSLLMFAINSLYATSALATTRATNQATNQASTPAFEDDSACLLCHKYPKMGRITDKGVKRSYQVIPDTFSSTVHRNVPCTDCHNYIKQLPHREVKRGVSCDTECHSIKNPATGKNFSHTSIYNKYKASVHGRDKIESGLEADKPYCITCHTNPIYNPGEDRLPEQIVDRCVVCHEDRKFVTNWYKHTSRRIREVKRSPAEIVDLCSNCHSDKALVERHVTAAKKQGRELGRKYAIAVESYNESFHGKVTNYGFTKAANCLDCHAKQKNYYMNVHDIRSSRDPQSPVHEKNKLQTCQNCHTRADANYAALDPHPTNKKDGNAFRYYASLIYEWVGNIVIALLISMAIIETIGRRRDGVGWSLHRGSSWWRHSKKSKDRVE
ncbi:MAG TPA: hypothetical protein ENJ08_18445 [Gammaproteobacteria bacterium]|nr:hypothetical protein [Gammaproteobacteria bacterium]